MYIRNKIILILRTIIYKLLYISTLSEGIFPIPQKENKNKVLICLDIPRIYEEQCQTSNGSTLPAFQTAFHRPHNVITTDIKTNLCHIHTSVSRHLTTRGNNKIPRTPPPHIISSQEILHSSHPCPTQNK